MLQISAGSRPCCSGAATVQPSWRSVGLAQFAAIADRTTIGANAAPSASAAMRPIEHPFFTLASSRRGDPIRQFDNLSEAVHATMAYASRAAPARRDPAAAGAAAARRAPAGVLRLGG